MNKLITLSISGCVILSIIMTVATPVVAVDNVTVITTDNFTIASGNLTISSGNLTIAVSGLQDSLTAAGVAAADEVALKLHELYIEILPLAFLIFMNIMAYTFRERYLCVLAGFVTMAYGFPIWQQWHSWSIIFVMFGIYSIVKGWKDTEYWARKKAK